MSDTPITFTPEEQLKLREIENNTNGFNNWKTVVSRSLYSGQDSVLVAQLIQYLHQMSIETSKAAEQIAQGAQARASTKAISDVQQTQKPTSKPSKVK